MRFSPDYERHLLDLARERGVEPVPIRAPMPLAPESTRAPGRPRVTQPVPGVMNKTEQAYADHLESLVRAGELRRWYFEAVKFKLGPRTHYTPDFLVVFSDGRVEWHEVKGGFIREDAQLKMKWFVREFPEFPLVIVRRVGGIWTYERRNGNG
jgi:hypothetical protein